MAIMHYSQEDFNKIPILGLVPYQGPTASPPSSPVEGQLWEDTDLHVLKFFNGTGWIRTDGSDIPDSTITSAKIADGAIVNVDINSAANIARSKLDFGSGLVNADIATGAAIARSKLDFGSGLVNADISASAAIALSKLATDPLARANHTGTQVASTISNFDTQVRTSRLDQMAAPTASVSMNSQRITSLLDPSSTTSQDAATANWTTTQIQNAINGQDWKASVRVATTANITLSGTQTIDGIACVAGDRVLVKNQTTQSANGIYVVAAGAWSRATDADNSGSTSEVTAGMTVPIEGGGTANGGSVWLLTTQGAITLGTTSLTFTQIGAAGSSYTADETTLHLSGNQFSLITPVTLANGGTGSGTASGARTALGITAYQKAGTTLGAVTAGSSLAVSHGLTVPSGANAQVQFFNATSHEQVSIRYAFTSSTQFTVYNDSAANIAANALEWVMLA